MKRKLLSVILAIAICASLAVPAMAAEFTDLKGHWAKEYMEDLADRGLLSGYTDGSMRPDTNITSSETLALLSHLYSPNAVALEFIHADFGDYVASTVPATHTWAYDEIEICLAAGIITKDELKNLDYSSPIKKERLALLLVRAMQKQSEAAALESSTLSFADAASISADCKGSVAELSQLGIVKGDDQNRFRPSVGVARAVVATMLSRSLDYLDNNKLTLTIKDYDGLTRTDGVIVSALSGSLELRGYDGLVREYKYTAAATVTVNGSAKALTSSYVGCPASVSIKNGAVSSIAVTQSSTDTVVQGVIVSIANDGIYVRSALGAEAKKYVIPSGAHKTLDGVEVTLSYLSKKDFVTLKLTNGKVTELTAVSKDVEIRGEITDIKFGTIVSIKLMDTSGVTYVFDFDIASPPKILRGTTEISVDRLSVGSNILVSLENFEIDRITTEGSESTLSGELTSITSTTGGTQWVISTDSGSVTLTLDKNAGAYSGKTSILMSDIHAGDSVTVVYYGNTITDVYLIRSTNSSGKLTGTVLAVNTSSKTVTILSTADKIVYINTENVSYIINASTGRAISLSSVSEDSNIVAYGTYTDSTNFASKLLVIEA